MKSVKSVVKKIITRSFFSTDNTDSTDKSFRSVPSVLSVVKKQFVCQMIVIHKELSESIIGAAMKVLNTLHPGLDEKLYENALVIELRKRGHYVEQ